ncbi:hypothetical protein GCM10017056_27430 [Seohaeicola zhoushanensis]|uniref:Uncharacterized protein n=1 Tax=Seohaeicola zhoushanensis TaxID=1569283 RepID=A0A8J3GYU4_9RHOB|nr:hypothetical protein GCM10017056_27430 [Seohaeicola zhoushanensis]
MQQEAVAGAFAAHREVLVGAREPARLVGPGRVALGDELFGFLEQRAQAGPLGGGGLGALGQRGLDQFAPAQTQRAGEAEEASLNGESS